MQIVGYATDAGEGDAGVLFSDGDGAEPEFRPLTRGAQLSYTLGERRCAGTVHAGEHVACDADAAPYCSRHDHTWVCARCTGTCLKDEMDCHEEHAIYLAAFAPDRFKVGVTRLWRLETRLREQGADRAAHVRTVKNGRIARELEAGIAAREDLPVPVSDSVRVAVKRRGLGRAVDADAWDRLQAAFDTHETFDFEYGLDLQKRPVAETMLTGTVRGTKGRVLVLDRGGSTYAVDLRDLVGHEVGSGRSPRDRQSSLGAFG